MIFRALGHTQPCGRCTSRPLTSGRACLFDVCARVTRSVVSNSVTPPTVAHQAPLSMGFSRQDSCRVSAGFFPFSNQDFVGVDRYSERRSSARSLAGRAPGLAAVVVVSDGLLILLFLLL